jgi:ketosteroid isomerase-like protein
MSSFDPMAAAIDWLDAYRAGSLSIVDLYSDDAALECECNGAKTLYGRAALSAYWRQRFTERPAGDLEDLQPDDDAIVVSYRVPLGVARSTLLFDGEGKIARCHCRSAEPGAL